MLVWPGIWNGYPLVFADSGTYLGQALIGYVGWDRPPFYSLFLHALHWRISLWPAMAGQGLLLAHLLYLVLRAEGHGGPTPLLLTAAGVAMLTGLPFVAAQLQPDLFTGVVVLCAWLIGFRQAALRPAERVYVMLLATLAVVVHQSHLPLAIGLALVVALLWTSRGWRPALWAFVRLMVPPLVAMLALLTVNLAAHRTLALSPYGGVFLAARMMFDPAGRAWLDRHCPSEAWHICGIRDQLGTDHNIFLWNLDGPLYSSLGGPKVWSAEASAIIRSVVVEDPVGVLRAAAENTLAQLKLSGTGDGLQPWPAAPGPEPLIRRFFPGEHAAFMAARQQRNEVWPLAHRLAPLHLVVFLVAVAVLLVAAMARPLQAPRGAVLAVLLLAALVGNAMVTGALSGPAARYQARLTWLGLVAVVAVLLPRRDPVHAAAESRPPAGTGELATGVSPHPPI